MALTKVKAGNILLTTPAASSNDVTPATTQYVTTALANMVDSAPSTLNTLNELAAALGDDANFSTTVTNNIAAKAPLASPTFTGDVDIDATDDLRLRFLNGSTFKAGIQVPTSTGDMISGAAVDDLAIRSQGNMLFSSGGNTERMRIDSAGKMGIGTNTNHAGSSLGYMLTVDSAGASGSIFEAHRTGNSRIEIYQNSNGGQYIDALGTTPFLALATGGTQRMRIDSSGRVLIGQDSGDAFNDDSMLRIQRTGDRVFQQFKCDADQNIQILFGDVDDDVESSIQYYPADKNLIFATGNNQDAMTIDSSQNVGIGTTNPQAKFDVTVGNAKTASAGVWGYLGKTNESSGYQALQCFQIGGSAADERRYEFQTIEQGASNDGIICLQKSGGRVFIGHDSADGNTDKLSISGSIGISNDGYIGAGSGFGPSNGAGSSSTIQLYSSSTGNMTFATNYSAGDEVHNMSGNTKFVVKRSAAGTSAVQFYTNDGGYQTGALNNGYHHTMRISGPSTYYWDNACQASGGFSTYSDEKLKKEITTITGALDKVAVMNGVTFKWKDAENRGSGDTGKQFGVIAQNMLEVDSELPTLNVDPLETNENIEDNSKDTDYYTMDYSRLTPYFIEAIKELKTKLEAAEARLATLEG